VGATCTGSTGQRLFEERLIAFGRKTDLEGKCVKEFVPELRGFDAPYIYEPWRAPVADQRRWGCVVRGDGSLESGGSGG
jgi:cryptochrome